MTGTNEQILDKGERFKKAISYLIGAEMLSTTLSKDQIAEFASYEEQNQLEQLEKEIKELKESRDYWHKRHEELSRKFNAFRESIKSIIVLVD